MLLVAAAICVALPRSSEPYPGDPPKLRVAKPTPPAFATSAAGFAMPGWRVEREIRGDLDRDGRPDLVVILKATDRNCVVPTSGASPMDTNPRLLLVAFGVKGGFRLQLANASVIPRVDDPYMDDPLGDDAVGIRRDVLRIRLSYWRSMGGWTTFSSTLSFRWDGTRMRLIGFDRESLARNSGETETLSVNYATGKAKATKGSMQDDIDDVTTTPRLRPTRPEALETIGDGLEYEPQLGGRR